MVSSKRAREHLVESHLPLARSVARQYAASGESFDDLVQVGAIGLVKAANRFDESRGVAFAAFAGPVIEGEIRRHLRDRSAPMRIPRDLQRASGELRQQRDQLRATIGHSPSTRELAAALHIDEEQVERTLLAELARESLPLPGGDEALEGLDQRVSSDDRLSLARCVRVLDERERKIVFLRFHVDMTERQIARELGISQAHVSRLLSDALARLRTELAGSNRDAGRSDSTVHSAISPGSSAISPPDSARKIAHNRSDDGQGAGRIAAVPASQAAATVEGYLELPYTIAVLSEREGEQARWTATVEELPGCAAHGRTPDEAVTLLRGAMESWLEAALAQRREIPLPGQSAKQQAASSHSGRFLVRMPGALHTQLAQAAEHEHLSLNRFITKVLAASVSPAMAPAPDAAAQAPGEAIEQQHPASHKPSRAFRIALAINIAVVVLAGLAAIVLLVLALQNGV
jgi:RNA polymerase sigma-B factor